MYRRSFNVNTGKESKSLMWGVEGDTGGRAVPEKHNEIFGQCHTAKDNWENISHCSTAPRVTYHEVWAVHKKNCDPFVFGPALAIDKIPEKCKQT